MTKPKRRLLRALERVVTWSLLVAPAVLVVLWLTFQHKPGWYTPIVLDDGIGKAASRSAVRSAARRARREALALADYISDRMVQGQRFDVVLSKQSVNASLAAFPHIWPDAAEPLPPAAIGIGKAALRSPAVHFGADEIHFGALYDKHGWRAIVSVAFSARVSKDGRSLRFQATGFHGGSLPIPRVILDRLLAPLLGDSVAGRDPRSRGDDRKADREAALPMPTLGDAWRQIGSVDDLFSGVRFRNRFTWFNGRRPFRIESITLDDGQLTLRVEPL